MTNATEAGTTGIGVVYEKGCASVMCTEISVSRKMQHIRITLTIIYSLALPVKPVALEEIGYGS